MNTRLLGILCLIGGAVKFIPALLSAAMPENATIDNLVYYSGIIAFPLLMAGPLGLYQLRAYGAGGTAKIGMTGLAITLFGLAFYLVNYFLGPAPLRAGIAAIATAIGITILGIAVLMAKRLNDWHRYAPLGVGVAYLIQVVFQLLIRLSQGLSPLSWLLGIWWLAWMVLGYVISTQKATAVSQA